MRTILQRLALLSCSALCACTTVTPLQTASTVDPGTTRLGAFSGVARSSLRVDEGGAFCGSRLSSRGASIGLAGATDSESTSDCAVIIGSGSSTLAGATFALIVSKTSVIRGLVAGGNAMVGSIFTACSKSASAFSRAPRLKRHSPE